MYLSLFFTWSKQMMTIFEIWGSTPLDQTPPLRWISIKHEWTDLRASVHPREQGELVQKNPTTRTTWKERVRNAKKKKRRKSFSVRGHSCLLSIWSQIIYKTHEILFVNKNINRTFFARSLKWYQKASNFPFFAQVFCHECKKSANLMPESANLKD